VKSPENHLVYLSIGSNIEDRYSNCLKGLHLLGETDAIYILERSPFYMTKPVDYIDQDWFINGVVKIGTTLDPVTLLQVLQKIEKKIGRKSNRIRFGPRILDLDIIFYDDSVMNQAELVIPHPRMHKRCFVLKPLCDIDPGIVHPVLNKTVQSLLLSIDDRGQEVIPYS
jgi:2-amino-4-hydroxy-6-hydroxymethyldihydropteridine diphosphokinase